MAGSTSTWADVRNEVRDTFRDTTQAFVGDPELLRYARRVLRDLSSKQVYGFEETLGTLTLTGASTYDLSALFPGFKELLTLQYNPGGTFSSRIELQYVNAKDFNLYPDTYSYNILSSSTLQLTAPGASSLTGALQVIFLSRYMVKVHGGATLAEFPVNDDDTFNFPERFLNVVTSGVLKYCFRKDRSHREDFTDAKEEFDQAVLTMRMEEPRRVSRVNRYARAAF